MSYSRKSLARLPVTVDTPVEMGVEGSATSRALGPKGPPRVGRLEQLSDWRRQIGKIYRMMRRGELPTSEGTRLIYALEAGARIAREEGRERHEAEQRAQVERLEHQLRELQAGRNQPALPALPTTATHDWLQED